MTRRRSRKKTYKEKESAQAEQIPETNRIRRREPTIRKEVAETSSMPAEAFMRTCAVASATDAGNQEQSGNFKALDAKLTTSLGRVLYRELGQHKNVLEEESAQRQETLGGGKTAGHAFPRSKNEGVLLEHKKILRVEKRDDSISASLTDWELVLCSLKAAGRRHSETLILQTIK